MPKVPPTYRVFKLEPELWWSGLTLAACVNAAQAVDPNAAPNPQEFTELFPVDLEAHQYDDVTGHHTFAERLAAMKAEPGFSTSPAREFYRGPIVLA